MSTLRTRPGEALNTVFHTFFRHYNFPCECRLVEIGRPGPESPVFLSGNYSYTVRLLRRTLSGMDCYLLVADSAGSNVWCAAGMNEFTENDVVDAINVADLARRVRHRRIIAPPFAAPGVDAEFVKKETGFRIVWGPAQLTDIPRYIENGFRCSHAMRAVRYGFRERLDAALSTATAYFLTALFVLVFFPRLIAGVAVVCFGVQLFYCLFFPWLPEEVRWRRSLATLAILSLVVFAVGFVAGWSLGTVLLWWTITSLVVLLSAGDMTGCTNIYKTTVLHWLKTGNYRSHFQPVVDPLLCNGCATCIQLCPKDVYAVLKNGRARAVAVHPLDCMECLACVKHCRRKAIFNRQGGKLKNDVKSIPDLDQLMLRDARHLAGELRWTQASVEVRNELPFVAPAASAPREAPGEAAPLRRQHSDG